MQRITTGSDPAGATVYPGPIAELHAHVALAPMLRLGAYVSHDISPAADIPARQMTEAGLRAKVSPPLFSNPWRAWAFVGFGYARTYAPSYHTSVLFMGDAGPSDVLVSGVGGGFFDIPLGVGVGYKLGGPWVPFVELGGHIGFGFSGDMYGGQSRDSGQPDGACGSAQNHINLQICEPYTGQDSFAVSLSVGVSFEE